VRHYADNRVTVNVLVPTAFFSSSKASCAKLFIRSTSGIIRESAVKHHGWPTQGNLRIGCPVNVRRPEEQVVLENRVSIMMPMTPAQPMGPTERLKLLAVETKRIKESGAPYHMERMTSWNDSVPPALLAGISQLGTASQEAMALLLNTVNWRPTPSGPALPASGINFMASNVPGPQTTWYLAGHEVTDFIPMIMLAGQLGYGVGITSYNDNMYIGMAASPKIVSTMSLIVPRKLARIARKSLRGSFNQTTWGAPEHSPAFQGSRRSAPEQFCSSLAAPSSWFGIVRSRAWAPIPNP
jgi:hypothetical protein